MKVAFLPVLIHILIVVPVSIQHKVILKSIRFQYNTFWNKKVKRCYIYPYKNYYEIMEIAGERHWYIDGRVANGPAPIVQNRRPYVAHLHISWNGLWRSLGEGGLTVQWRTAGQLSSHLAKDLYAKIMSREQQSKNAKNSTLKLLEVNIGDVVTLR